MALPGSSAVVLGIDAAWTVGQPSGVAILASNDGHWTCHGVAPSYRQFAALGAGEQVDWAQRCSPDPFDAGALLMACRALVGRTPDVIAVDMPLASGPITARRVSDSLIARTFGAGGAAVHSPTLARPGPVADGMRDSLAEHGYRLALNAGGQARTPALLETYPHPVVMRLCSARRRVPYKLARAAQYWPNLPLLDRRRLLVRVWQAILLELDSRIAGISLPPAARLPIGNAGALKAFEDGLDALICAVTAISYLENTARAFGDGFSAIWLPAGCEDYVRCPDRFGGILKAAAEIAL